MTKIKSVIGAVLATASALAIGVATLVNGADMANTRADNTYHLVLNDSNSPAISAGSGTMIDNKGIAWEYSNVSDYNDGHITLNNNGYFGISSSTNYGITAITSVVADFTSNDNELWLLTSYNGVDWHEQCMLETGESTTLANGWRYVRFYNWSDYNTGIDIDSVNIGYDCSGETSSEDVDGAHIENVGTVSSNLTYEEETTNVSPLGNSTRAVRFIKSGSSNTASNAIIYFGKEYKLKDIKDKKVEFDMYTTNINYGKTVELAYQNSMTGKVDSSVHTSYKTFNLGDNWYHIEVHINALASMFCNTAQGDTPAVGTKSFNGVRLNIGNAIIDNLRIGSVPSSNTTEVGIFNKDFLKKGNTCNVTDTKNYWLKISWTGVFHSCQMIFSDNSIAEQVTGLEYPFYIHPKAVGTTNITVKLCVGYDRRYVFQAITLEVK